MMKLFNKFFGSRNDRLIKRYNQRTEAVNALSERYRALSDADLKGHSAALRGRLAAGATLADLLPEAFAAVREASERTLGMRHFDVQIVGGMVLDEGKIAEMRTGEGKTLVATLAAYLNALSDRGVHIVTVNDYLARRDAVWMGKLYHFLGLSVGVINASGGRGPDNASFIYDPAHHPATEEDGYLYLRPVTRREAYAADITYGTNNEFGFDYLRDNMAFRAEDRVQRELAYAIVDEVDSILIDEARTPLIISGAGERSSELYQQINRIVPQLVLQRPEDIPEGQSEDPEAPGDYSIDEKTKQVFLTESGYDRVEELLREAGLLSPDVGLYNPQNVALLHHLHAALRAHSLYHRDVEYVVRNGQIVIVDEFTGRTMPGRRWSEGLHQAIEAKEGVAIRAENQTLASITFQNYFRLYDKLAGMTGTADTEAYEFQQIYGLEVVVVPTHKPMIRKDLQDLVYLTAEEKFQAIIAGIKDCVARGQPTLVGTASIETSEFLSGRLQQESIDHQVLNAKQHEREAQVIAQAGRPGTVTIATNMAGRGTDIVLGGSLDHMLAELGDDPDPTAVEQTQQTWQQLHEQVVAAGGLHIVGTERHESRRIDNQLRGRSGRQGDPGSSRFYISLEDNLMRIFASDKIRGVMQRLGMEKGQAIESRWISGAIENAQRKVEAHNFDIRKNLLEYDDVANDQRRVIYQQRKELLEAEQVKETFDSLRQDTVDTLISEYIPPGSLDEQWDVAGLTEALHKELNLDLPVQQWLDEDESLHEEPLRERIHSAVDEAIAAKEAEIGSELMRRVEKDILLQVLDSAWKEHLAAMDYLRQGIGLRGYAQRNPKQEYKREAFQMFQSLLERIKRDSTTMLMQLELQPEAPLPDLELAPQAPPQMQFSHPEAGNALDDGQAAEQHAAADATALAQAEQAAAAATEGDAGKPQPYRRETPKIGRNDPCWCGSGKKYKHCHGKL